MGIWLSNYLNLISSSYKKNTKKRPVNINLIDSLKRYEVTAAIAIIMVYEVLSYWFISCFLVIFVKKFTIMGCSCCNILNCFLHTLHLSIMILTFCATSSIQNSSLSLKRCATFNYFVIIHYYPIEHRISRDDEKRISCDV